MVQKEHVVFFQKKISENIEELTERIFTLYEHRYPEELEKLTEEDLKDNKRIVYELFETIAKTMLYVEKSNEIAAQWGKEIGKTSVRRGGSLSEALERIGMYKEVLWTFIEEAARDTDYNFTHIIEVVTRTDDIFNHIVHGFSLSFAQEEERILKDYEEKYLKLSTPIVPIKDSVAILPIIGEIDQKRADVLMDETLKEVSNWNIDWLIIDLSGVYDVNNSFMSHLHRLLDSLTLLGITPLLTGMRPDLSMQATKLGLFQTSKNRITTCSSLKQAIELLDKKNIS
ncbi:rsbT co-antagonist protein RsbR [Thalassobacillus cyri]|uniref:RsbT co-antagonist protein RsbR n=1 Tax=Thalassobacillus cyri TaxID=571932 RepID=A0A1H4DGT5_9BACI|nr:STAS domain-containing protein [Thalassobacillus cyri]SEA71807.1 rsbT co-antagonist protein RsbR [Thalassobacillus cyri]